MALSAHSWLRHCVTAQSYTSITSALCAPLTSRHLPLGEVKALGGDEPGPLAAHAWHAPEGSQGASTARAPLAPAQGASARQRPLPSCSSSAERAAL